jgi:phosphoribosylformimino-5-aminoimidazole carboxamide ribonucleotide (ProFAR) isomerase
VLIPCIDLQGGQAVQLVRGRRRELAVGDVFGLLDKFQAYPWLHLIDLDAAMGKPANSELLEELCLRARKQYRMRVRIGGGIRSVPRAAAVAGWGAEQIIVGSAVFRLGRVDTRFLGRLGKSIGPGRIVVALDTAGGRIVTDGWRRKLGLGPNEVMPRLEPFCAAFLCTDVDREGTLSGANLRWFRQLRGATTHPVIAAGGIESRHDISALERIGMDAAVGMALYKNRLR